MSLLLGPLSGLGKPYLAWPGSTELSLGMSIYRGRGQPSCHCPSAYLGVQPPFTGPRLCAQLSQSPFCCLSHCHERCLPPHIQSGPCGFSGWAPFRRDLICPPLHSPDSQPSTSRLLHRALARGPLPLYLLRETSSGPPPPRKTESPKSFPWRR